MLKRYSWLHICRSLVILLLMTGMVVVIAGCQRSGSSPAEIEATPTPTPEPTPTPDGVVTTGPDAVVTVEPETTPTPEPATPTPTPTPSSSDPNLVIDDPLTNGTSVGTVYGRGEFTEEGYKVTTSWGGYIAYSTDIYKNIRLEFDARGYVPNENDGGEGKMVVFEIFDSPHEYSWHGVNYCGGSEYSLVHLRKRGLFEGRWHYKVDGLELKLAGKNCDERKTWEHGHSPAGHPITWDPNVTYHWVITIQDFRLEITRDGFPIFTGVKSDEFNPDGPLNIRIGGVSYGGRSGPQDVVYSNVKIFR